MNENVTWPDQISNGYDIMPDTIARDRYTFLAFSLSFRCSSAARFVSASSFFFRAASCFASFASSFSFLSCAFLAFSSSLDFLPLLRLPFAFLQSSDRVTPWALLLSFLAKCLPLPPRPLQDANVDSTIDANDYADTTGKGNTFGLVFFFIFLGWMSCHHALCNDGPRNAPHTVLPWYRNGQFICKLLHRSCKRKQSHANRMVQSNEHMGSKQ